MHRPGLRQGDASPALPLFSSMLLGVYFTYPFLISSSGCLVYLGWKILGLWPVVFFFFGVCPGTLTNRGSSYCCLPSWAYTSGDFGVKLQLKTWLKEGADWSLVCCLGNFLFFPVCDSVSTRLQSEPLSRALWLLGLPFIHWRWLFAEMKAVGKSLLLHFFCVTTISLALKVVLWNLCTSF